MNILDLIKEISKKMPQLQELTVNYKGAMLLEYDILEVTPSELKNTIFQDSDSDFQFLFDSIINSTLIDLQEECNGFIQIGFTEPSAYVKYYGIVPLDDVDIETEDRFEIDLTSEID
jgi:hypothetical protein